MTKTPKILLVDDHNLVLDGLELILSTDSSLSCIGRVNSGAEAIGFVHRHDVDLILLDINLPDTNGIEVCKEIYKSHPHIKIIGLSMMDEIHVIKQLKVNGAKGFLLKNSGKEEILKAIHTVMSGKSFYDHSILERLLEEEADKPSTPLFPSISRREKEILSLIIEEYTTKEIAAKLFISFGTVETHRRNLISKLGVRNTAGLVRVAVEYKLV